MRRFFAGQAGGRRGRSTDFFWSRHAWDADNRWRYGALFATSLPIARARFSAPGADQRLQRQQVKVTRPIR
jgi:hypothetical protein